MSDTNGFDLNVFTILFTNTKASVIWQDCSEEQLQGTELFPDYNLDDDHEVWRSMAFLPPAAPLPRAFHMSSPRAAWGGVALGGIHSAIMPLLFDFCSP